jgi:hypothetical protein
LSVSNDEIIKLEISSEHLDDVVSIIEELKPPSRLKYILLFLL